MGHYYLNGQRGTGAFPLDSWRKSVHKLGADVQIAWMRGHFMGGTPFYAYWVGGPLALSSGCCQELCPDFRMLQSYTFNVIKIVDFGPHDI